MSTKKNALTPARIIMLVILLSGITAVSRASPGCWQPSTPTAGPQICPEGETCVEWEMGIAYDCCYTPPGPGPALVNCAGCLVGPMERRKLFTDREQLARTFLAALAPAKTTTTQSRSAIRHTVPRLAVMVDDALIDPETLTGFDGQPLHFLISREALAQSALFAFTTWEALFDTLQTHAVGSPSLIVREAPAAGASGVVFYAEEAWKGAPYFLPEGQVIDLTMTWWDNRIASLRGVGTGSVVTLFENADLSGSSLTLTTDLGWPDLAAFGWADRASTVVVWPVSQHATNQRNDK